MAYKKKLYGTRLDEIQEEKDNQVYVVEVDGKKVSNTPTVNTSKYINLAPIKETAKTSAKSNTKTSAKTKKDDNDKWFKSGAFKDGYQIGDLTKTTFSTLGDIGLGVTKGVLKLGEGVIDLGAYGVSAASRILGADDFANNLKYTAKMNTTDEFFAPLSKSIDKNSALGNKSDAVTEGIGTVAGILLTGGAGGAAGFGTAGTTALTTGVTGLSSMGSGMSEAYQSGATDGEAVAYGTIAGLAEAGSELLFGGLGKAVNAVGLSKGLLSVDDALAKKVSSKISNQIAKNFTEYGIKAGAEGFEEVASGFMQALGKKATYMSEEELGQIIKDENLLEQFITGAITSGIAQSGFVPGMKQGSVLEANKTGRDFITGYTQNEQTVIDSLVNEQTNQIAKQTTLENELNKAIEGKEVEQGGILSTKEKNALKSKIQAQIDSGEIDISSTKVSNKDISKIREAVEENMQKGLLDINTIESVLGTDTDLSNDSFLQKSYMETAKRKESFTYDNEITDVKEKAVYESAAKYFNNTTRSHEFVERVAKISKDKGTNYGFINNEELQTLGHDVEGKQVNGLVRTNKNGEQTVLINVDSPKALETIVGHETTHLLEGTQEYNDLQEAIFNYAKEKGDFDTRQETLNALYEGVENANVDSELTADLVGDYLFTDTDFINSLSTQKPTVFQKIKEVIDDLVVRFTGTKEEKTLREVQKKFKEAYKQNVTSKATTQEGIEYSLTDNQGRELSKEQKEYFKDSKVRDDNGNLLTLYHGTNENFDTFENVKTEPGYWFTEDKEYASEHGKNIMEVNLNLTNPLDVNTIEDEEILWDTARKVYGKENVTEKEVLSNKVKDKLKALGYDGMIWEHSGKNTYIAFEPSQIKKTDADIRYSLNDNQGRELSKEQKEYFKDSKVRDDNGNLLTMYHGTDSDFTIFDKDLSDEDNVLGQGLYFTANKEQSEKYGSKQYETYLNITNPLIIDDLTTQALANKIQSIDPNADIIDFDYGVASTEKMTNYLIENGYDGIKAGNDVYVAFDSSQIKNVDNTKPTDNPDIRYSLSKDNTNLKEQQLEIVLKENPMRDDYHTGIRTIEDIKTYQEALQEDLDGEIQNLSPDFKQADLEKALNTGKMIVYSSYPIEQGIFVTPSKMEAQYYAGKGKVYSKEIDLTDVAWIDTLQGQYAKVINANLSLSQQNEAAPKNPNLTYGEDIKLQVEEAIAPLKEQINELTEQLINNANDDIEQIKKDVENFSKQIDAVKNGTFPKNDMLTLGKTPKVLQELGLPDFPITITQKHLDTIMNESGKYKGANYHNLGEEIVKKLPEALNNPLDILKSNTKDDSIVLTTDLSDKQDRTIIASIKIDGKGNVNDIRINTNVMTSAYGKDNYDKFMQDNIKNGNLLYDIDQGIIKKIDKKTVGERLQLPIRDSLDSSVKQQLPNDTITINNIIPQNENYASSNKKILNLSETSNLTKASESKLENVDLVTKTKKQLRETLLGTEQQKQFITNALDNAKNRSMVLMNNTDTIRNTELVFGREAGKVINEAIFQKEIDNEADSIAWQNQERQEIKDLGIKARSEESAAVQKYGEKQWVNETGEIVAYGDKELSKEFPDIDTQNKIKNAARVIRNKYDNYIDEANNVLTGLGFEPIKKRNDYMRHFQELNDVFTRYGIPFNAQNMQEHVLPTDINGLTEFWSPQKNYFANMQPRKGIKTTYDAITGIDGYISGISNLIFHTEDIQRGRAFEELIRETYGESKGWDNLEKLPDELKQARAEKIQDNHLSNYAAWVHEWTNNIAGKKNKIDRSIESMFGRKVFSFLDNSRKQVGSNMVGGNISSSLTNFVSPIKAMAKTKKLAFAKGTADTIKNIFVKDDFMDNNKFLISRMGTDMISKNAWQKIQDAGYVFMKGSDWFTANQIVRSKYYELKAKGMSEQQAHTEAGKFAARIMGDRTKGAAPQIYNSKLLGLITQFQLEVNNDLYNTFYDTYQESKENAQGNALKMAAGMTFTLGQLFAFTHVFNKTFEAIAGYNPALDVIEILKTAFGWGEEDDDEKTTSERLKEAADMLVDGLPYVNILTGGGRIPVASGLPNLVGVATGGKDQYGNELTLKDELKKLLYLIPPTAGNQIKKTYQGLSMFDEDLPVSGSYTDSGNLRFPVEDTLGNRVQAGLFGQYASENAGIYFDEERAPLKEKQIQEYADLDLPIREYWDYRDGLKGLNTLEEKFEYINDLDVTDEQKNIMINNIVDRKEEVDMSNYDDYESYEEFDFAIKNEDKYNFLQENNISYSEYVASDESKEAYNWAFKNPDSYSISKAVTDDVVIYRQYKNDIYDIAADKDENGDSIRGSRKEKIISYVNGLDLSIPQKAILIRQEYTSFNDYNNQIVEYVASLNISYEEKVKIIEGLDMTIGSDGRVYWD